MPTRLGVLARQERARLKRMVTDGDREGLQRYSPVDMPGRRTRTTGQARPTDSDHRTALLGEGPDTEPELVKAHPACQ
jgi:hypothetical protein